MNWRGVADVLFRRTPRPDDERSTKARHLDALEVEANETNAEIHRQAAASSDRLAEAVRNTRKALRQ